MPPSSKFNSNTASPVVPEPAKKSKTVISLFFSKSVTDDINCLINRIGFFPLLNETPPSLAKLPPSAENPFQRFPLILLSP